MKNVYLYRGYEVNPYMQFSFTAALKALLGDISVLFLYFYTVYYHDFSHNKISVVQDIRLSIFCLFAQQLVNPPPLSPNT